MLLDRAVKLQRELKSRVKDCYRESIHFGRTHEKHLERIKTLVWESEEYKRSPRWLKLYLHGVSETCFDMLYETPLDTGESPLVSIIIGPDCKHFGPKDDSWLAESPEYKSAMKTIHAWRRYWNKGELRAW